MQIQTKEGFSGLNGFIGNNCLTLYDVAKLKPDSYTYVSSTESCGTSWLDNLIVSGAETVTMIDIKYNIIWV